MIIPKYYTDMDKQTLEANLMMAERVIKKLEKEQRASKDQISFLEQRIKDLINYGNLFKETYGHRSDL